MLNVGGPAWQQSLISGAFQKVWLISFLIYHLDVSVSGYLSEVSPIKVPKTRKKDILISRYKMMTQLYGETPTGQ